MNKTILALTVIGAIVLSSRNALAEEASGNHGNFGPSQTAQVQKHRQEREIKVQSFHDEQKSENKEFEKSLNDLTPSQRLDAITKHMKQQHQANMDFRRQMYAQDIQKLREALDKNTKLSAEQKKNVLDQRDLIFAEDSQHIEKKFTENINLINQIIKDSSLTAQQKQDKITEFRLKNQVESQGLHPGPRGGRKTKPHQEEGTRIIP